MAIFSCAPLCVARVLSPLWTDNYMKEILIQLYSYLSCYLEKLYPFTHPLTGLIGFYPAGSDPYFNRVLVSPVR
jgi:hypothetical protein